MSRVEGRVYTDDHTRCLHVTELADGTLELLADADLSSQNAATVTLTVTPQESRRLRLLLAAYERNAKDRPGNP